MLCSFETVEQALTTQQNWQMDGAVMVLPHRDDITRAVLDQATTPLVIIDRWYEDKTMLSVTADDRKGGYIAARHLLQLGHSRIGFAANGVEALRLTEQGRIAALLSGEGCEVIGGSVNLSGSFTFKTRRVGDDTVLSGMVRMVEQAQGSKAPIAGLADKISGIFVPAVGAIALVSAVIWLLAGQSFGIAL